MNSIKDIAFAFFSYLALSAFIVFLNVYSIASKAEDIEVYRGQSVGIRQNSLFVMDTSGSMGWYEEAQLPIYDPKVTYPDHGFNAQLNYFSNDYQGNGKEELDITELQKAIFPDQALVCENALESLQTTGFYTGRFKRWDSNKKDWLPSKKESSLPQGSEDISAILECKADEGRHPDDSYVDVRGRESSQQYIVTDRSWRLPREYSKEWKTHIKYLYTGNFLNYQLELDHLEKDLVKSRMQIAREAAIAVVKSTSGIRLGLMRFDSEMEGGFIDIAIDDVESISDEFEDKVSDYIPWNGTPLSESYYEAALYFRGDSVRFGKDSYSQVLKPGETLIRDKDGYIDKGKNKHTTKRVDTPSVLASRSANTYLSPLDSACQTSSTIILFTDGAPSYDDQANSKIKQLISGINFPIGSGLTHNCSGSGGCADELAYFLNNFDQNLALPGKQIIRTFVIGGFFDGNGDQSDIRYMESIAHHGGGEYYSASDYQSIVDALQRTLQETSDVPVTFVAPAVAANSYNSLEHLDQLFYAMFVPQAGNNWNGNLKSYRLNSAGEVVDAKGDLAILDSGIFSKESQSYWTEGINDGEDVVAGGAASRLTSDYKIFTHLETSAGEINTLLTRNTISKTLLGLPEDSSAELHQQMIDWANRKSPVTEDGIRREMEDPIHSRPLVVSYNTDGSNGEKIQQGVVFVGTNSGYLHAFKADKKEFKNYFSYIPKELLNNIPSYVDGENLLDKTYGIDGPMNYWHMDINRNGQLDIDQGEKMYLFFGLRRGGRQYYALDITNPDKPKYAWQINGGEGDYKNLGQTWSNLVLAKVPWNGEEKVVLLAGGGYDPAEDDQVKRTEHSMGNSVYMIDPQTGKRLWFASNNNSDLNLFADHSMTSSITSDITTVDFDGDGISDYFFVSDLGGRIWRFDINKSNQGKGNFASAGLIFDANSESNHYQRFYYAPSISYFRDEKNNDEYLSLAIGSGFRAHPLAPNGQDSFYLIKQRSLTTAPERYDVLTPDNLVELTFNEDDDDIEDKRDGNKQVENLQALNHGWKLALAPSEKVLAKALTSQGDIHFTTFSPTVKDSNPGSCIADVGTSSAYLIDVKADNQGEAGTSPIVKKSPMGNIGIPAQPIEIRTGDSGDKAFCAENPAHESCQPCEGEECKVESCEANGAIVLSGTQNLGGEVSRCDLIRKDYWLQE